MKEEICSTMSVNLSKGYFAAGSKGTQALTQEGIESLDTKSIFSSKTRVAIPSLRLGLRSLACGFSALCRRAFITRHHQGVSSAVVGIDFSVDPPAADLHRNDKGCKGDGVRYV